jgi:hypothetical protein
LTIFILEYLESRDRSGMTKKAYVPGGVGPRRIVLSIGSAAPSKESKESSHLADLAFFGDSLTGKEQILLSPKDVCIGRA